MKARALKRIALTLLAVWMICCFSGTALAATKVSECLPSGRTSPSFTTWRRLAYESPK